jgi:hypothetical protein
MLPVTHAPGTIYRVVSALPGAVTLYDQNDDDNGIAVVSSTDDADFYAYSSYGADDFSVPVGHKWRVTQIASGMLTGGGSAGGGLVGWNLKGLISGSHAAGDVSFTSVYGSGGLVGRNSGAIRNSYATGAVTLQGDYDGCVYEGGGLVGFNFVDYDGHVYFIPTIENSYSLGDTAGTGTGDCPGGFIGVYGNRHGYYSKITQTYTIGHVSGPHLGGFVSFSAHNHPGSITASYWDMDTSGANVGCGHGKCTGITGLTDAQLKSGLPKGFDPKIWAQSPNINNGYPYLRANPPQ